MSNSEKIKDIVVIKINSNDRKKQYRNYKSLSEDFSNLFNNEFLSDITFIVGKEQRKVYCHKIILSQRSKYFSNLFSIGLKESFDKEIKKENISYDNFCTIVKYLYSGEIELNVYNVLPILATSDEMDISKIKQYCFEFVKDHINHENALLLLDKAYKFHCDELIESCFEYVGNNSVDVLSSDTFYHISSSTLHNLLDSEILGIPEIEVFISLVLWGLKRINAIKRLNLKEDLSMDELDVILSDDDISIEDITLLEDKKPLTPMPKSPIPVTITNEIRSPSPSTGIPKNTKELRIDIRSYHSLKKSTLNLLKKILDPFLGLIRYPIMESHQLTDIVEPFGIVEYDLLLEAYRFIAAPDRSNGTKRCYIRKGLSDALNEQFDGTRILSEEHRRILLDWWRQNDDSNVHKRKKWVLKYIASKDSFDCKVFHKLCDGKGPSINVFHTTDGYIFGGYNTHSWSSQGGWETASDTWLFSLVNPFKDGARKLKVKNPSRAVYNHPQFGPTFGGGGGLSYFDPYDIYIDATMSKGHTNLGNAYSTYKGGWRSETAQQSLAGSLNSWSLDEVEVFILV